MVTSSIDNLKTVVESRKSSESEPALKKIQKLTLMKFMFAIICFILLSLIILTNIWLPNAESLGKSLGPDSSTYLHPHAIIYIGLENPPFVHLQDLACIKMKNYAEIRSLDFQVVKLQNASTSPYDQSFMALSQIHKFLEHYKSILVLSHETWIIRDIGGGNSLTPTQILDHVENLKGGDSSVADNAAKDIISMKYNHDSEWMCAENLLFEPMLVKSTPWSRKFLQFVQAMESADLQTYNPTPVIRKGSLDNPKLTVAQAIEHAVNHNIFNAAKNARFSHFGVADFDTRCAPIVSRTSSLIYVAFPYNPTANSSITEAIRYSQISKNILCKRNVIDISQCKLITHEDFNTKFEHPRLYGSHHLPYKFNSTSTNFIVPGSERDTRKIAVQVVGIGKWQFLGDSILNKLWYTKMHGYDLIIVHTNNNVSTHGAYMKLYNLQQSLPKYKWIFQVDMDHFFTDFDIKLEDIIANATNEYVARARNEKFSSKVSTADVDSDFTAPDIIAAHDCNGLNSGAFLIRGSDWSKKFVDSVVELDSTPTPFKWVDQGPMGWILTTNILNGNMHFQKMPLFMFNAYYLDTCGTIWQPGFFAIHFVFMDKGLLTSEVLESVGALTYPKLLNPNEFAVTVSRKRRADEYSSSKALEFDMYKVATDNEDGIHKNYVLWDVMWAKLASKEAQ